MRVPTTVVLSTCVVLGAAQAELAQDGELSIRAARDSKEFEPIRVLYTVENKTSETLVIDLGWNREGTFSFAVTGPNGAVEKVTPSAPPTGGLSAPREVKVEPHGRFSGVVVLSEWIDLAPGSYHVVVRSAAVVRRSTAGNPVVLSDGSYPFELTVSPSTSEEIRQLCERLSQQALASDYSDDAMYAARALAKVRNGVAIQYLDTVSRRGAWAWITIPAIAKQTGPEAKRALESLSNSNRPDVAAIAASVLKGSGIK